VSDILLGARRPQRTRRLARRLFWTTVFAVALVAVALFAFRRATGYPTPSGEIPADPLVAEGTRLTYLGSSLERTGNLWVLRTAGPPFRQGVAAARLVVAPDANALDRALLGDDPPTDLLGGAVHDYGLRWRFRLLHDAFSAARREELGGMAAVWGDYQRLVWREATFDVGAAPAFAARGAQGGVGSGLAFVLAGSAPLPRVMLGRAFHLPGAGEPVVSFVKSPGAIPFARVGWAGEVGAVTGVNGESIAVAVNPTVTQDVRASVAAEPIALLCRDLLEQAHTLDEAIALLQAAKPLGAASFLVVDGKGGSWAVIERTPSKATVVRSKGSVAIGDFLHATDLAKDAENERQKRLRPPRLERLTELLVKPPGVDAAAAAALLRDRRGKGDTRLPFGSAAAVDDFGAGHVAVVDVTSLTLWVGDGPGAAGAFRAFDLRHELLEEAPRAQGSSLPAETGVDIAAARAVGAARDELGRAARHLRRKEMSGAADAVERALALSPDLPEAWKLAADLKRLAGDTEGAQARYRRYLDLGATTREDEEEARAFVP
jgi:isopenicillin-N N-acyltransferase like protein